jgi:predicted RND superfamily exporter protein
MKRRSLPEDRTFFERWSLLILTVAVMLLPLIFMGARRALRSNRNDVREWLPSDFPQTAVHRWFRQHFPHEQFVLISWEGCTLDDPRLDRMVQRLWQYTPEGAQQRRPAGDNLPAQRGEASQVAGSFRWFPSSSTSTPVYFKSVFSGRTLVEQFRQRYPNMSEEEILRRLEGTLIGLDHRTTCVVATLLHELHGPELKSMVVTLYQVARELGIEPADSRAGQFGLVGFFAGIRDLFREITTGKRTDVPQKLHLGGPPIDNFAIDTEGQRTLYRLAALSAVVGLGVSLACLRSLRLTLIVFLLAIVAAGLGLSLVYFTGQHVDSIMLSMPSLVYVLAISASIHLINYYHDAIKTNGLRGACERAVEHGFQPCFLAALTTAFGLGSLALSHVTPISKFGIYAALGVMATLVLTFLVLPAFLQVLPSRKLAKPAACACQSSREGVIDQWWRWVGGQLVRYRTPVALGCTAIMMWGALGLPQIHTSVKLMKFFSADAPIVQDYAWLEQHLGPLVPMEIILRIDNSRCSLSFLERMRLAERVEQAVKVLPPVGGAISPATFAPELNPELGTASAFERVLGINRRRLRDDVLNKRLESHRSAFRDYLAVEGDGPLSELGLGRDLEESLRAAGLNSIDAIERFAGKESIAHRLSTSLGWPEDLARDVEKAVRQWQSAHAVELWRISARVEALSDLDYGHFVEDLKAVVEPILAEYRASGVEGIEAVYTGLVPLVYQVQHELFRSLFQSLMLAFVLISGVMILLLRSVWGGLVAMLPNLFPAVVVFGAMGWGKILVDVGTMMTASVALGVAVDDTIHFLTWFQRGLQMGLSRGHAVRYAYGRCARAMTQTSLVAGLGLAVFTFSAFTPTQRFGSLMLILLAAALFGDLIYYPALLVGPLGANFSRRRPVGSGNGAPEPSKGAGRDVTPTSTKVSMSADEAIAPAGLTGDPQQIMAAAEVPGAQGHAGSPCQPGQESDRPAEEGPVRGFSSAAPAPLGQLLSGTHWSEVQYRVFPRR